MMRKLFFTFLIMGLTNMLVAQTVVTLNLPNPCNTVGVETIAPNESFMFTVYPNPANDYVLIDIESKEPILKAGLQVFDITGKQVWNETFFSENTKCIKQLNTSHFKAGVYTILIQTNSKKVGKQFIINKN